METNMDPVRGTTAADGPYVDWAAIFAGGVIAVAIAVLLGGFGAALGLTAISAEPGEGSGLLGLIITGLWVTLTLIVSYLTGGYIAGRMRRRTGTGTPDEATARDGINGLVVWGLGTIATTVILANVASFAVGTAGNVAAAAGQAAGSVASAAGSAVGAVADDFMPENPLEYAQSRLMRSDITAPDDAPQPGSDGAAGSVDTTGGDSEELAADVSAIMAEVLRTGEISDDDRAYLVSAVAANTDLTEEEVNTRVDEAVARVVETRDEAARLAEEAKQKAIDVAETARKSGIVTAFVLAAGALIAAVAAYIGAVHGGHHRDDGRLFSGLSYRYKRN